MKSKADQLVDDYLKRLQAEAADLPRARRKELIEEISEHIAEARSVGSESEAEVRTLLDRLGDPADIAAEAAERSGTPPRRRGRADVPALILLLIGGVVVPAIGWLVGVVLLWMSETWTTREKLIGTFVVPGGLALPLFLMSYPASSELCYRDNEGPEICTGGPSTTVQVLGILFYIALFVAPFATTAFLARRRSRAVALA
jgi:uncharacterized coiled-coil protein SlyX